MSGAVTTSGRPAELRLARHLALPIEAVTETFAIIANRGAGKALAIDTPIATPTGWSTMGELRPGDRVFGADGRPKAVLAAWDVQRGRPCYEVVFDDGASVVADGEHLWLTDTLLSRMADSNARRYTNRGRGGRPQCARWRTAELRTTEEIAATLRYGKRGELNHSVDTASGLETASRPLPIDPYVLGAWLGDGTTSSATITSADEQIIDRIRDAGYEIEARWRRGRATLWQIGHGPDGRKLFTVLREEGLLGNKHVPDSYLRASCDQRLALLAGMLDTDGWVESIGEAVVGFKVEVLADAVHELAVSLGWKARRKKKPARLYGVDCGVSHVVRFRPDVQVFALDRKRLPLNEHQARRHRRRMIQEARSVPSVPVRCITVEGDGMFLAGRDMIPTHNSSTARVFVEELAMAGQPVVVLDVKGDWWGLRSSASGKSEGIPFVIFGGDHADVPLEHTAGRLLAQVLVDTRLLAVLDMSAMSKTKARQFTMEFAEEVYRLNRDPMHLVADEADVLIPQRASADVARLLGAMEDVAKRGRGRGLGLTVITQRPAEVSKSVLELMETLIVLRVTGPRTRKAITDWIDDHASEPAEIRTVISSLSSLQVGEAWVWSPGWLRLLQRAKIRPIRTFDSHATPKPGERRAQPQRRAEVDLEALGEQIAATVERAKQDDPRALRAQIAQLERDLAAATAARPEPERVEVPILTNGAADALDTAAANLATVRDQLAETAREAQELIAAKVAPVLEALATAWQPPAPTRTSPTPAPSRAVPPARQPTPTRPTGPAAGDRSLSKAQRAILTALGQHGTRTTTQVALLTGYSHTSGGFRNALSALRSAGHAEGRGTITITAAGLAALGPYTPLPTGQALVDWWKANHLGKCERAILDILVDRYPAPVPVPDIADAAGYSASSGGFRNSLSRLRSLELATGRGELALNPTLMSEAGGDAR